LSRRTKKERKPDPEPYSAKKQIHIFSNHKLSWIVFIPTVVIVFISLISAVFPALITRTTSPLHASVLQADVIDPYTTGILSAPLIIINAIILGIGFAYYKKSIGSSFFHKISSFELSKKQAIIAVIIILAIFSAITAETLTKEETWVDYTNVKNRLVHWSITQFTHSFEPHFRYFLLSASLNLFGNIRVVPFAASAALLLLTYFFTANITRKRFAGVVSMVLLLQSNIFVSYSTTASYDNFWILLYLLSLYLIQKFWPPTSVPFFFTIFSKALTVAFLPMTLYFITRSNISRKSRIYSLASYGVIIVILFVTVTVLKINIIGSAVALDSTDFWEGFSAIEMQMRFDYVVLIFLLPLTIMLFFASRRGILHADSAMMFILVILLTAPFLHGFTQITNQPYRFVSLSVFFAIGAGILLSNRTRKQVEVSSSM
jgi:hypothetical protein